MGKLVLLFILANMAQNQMSSDVNINQAEEVREYAYWDNFSETFEKTADFWKAESAALEAESIASDRTGLDEWLSENKNNIFELESKNSCES
jgi:hypothetical protein